MPVSLRERKFAAMRRVSDWVDFQRQQEHKLRPNGQQLMVGSSDFDYLLKATVGESYLRVLRRGGNPEEAHTQAVKDGNECVAIWNNRTHKKRVSIVGKYELKRWDKAGEAEADVLHLHFLSLLRAV